MEKKKVFYAYCKELGIGKVYGPSLENIIAFVTEQLSESDLDDDTEFAVGVEFKTQEEIDNFIANMPEYQG